MTHTPLDPATLAVMGTPNYTHAMVTEGVSKWLNIAGQVGVRQDGSTVDGTLDQCRQAFANIGELLKGAGMTPEDVCHLRIYLTDRNDILALRQARTEFFGADKVLPSTLIMVSGLVDPAWKVELEIMAAR
ncbi:MAG: RidA family protein [Alphaproteobacteria bacterium]|nr:RidA family protein [Alphaproteobacteria bacterium]